MSLLLAGLGGVAAGFGARHFLDDTIESEEEKNHTLVGMSSIICPSLQETSCKKIPDMCTFDESAKTCASTLEENKEKNKALWVSYCSKFDDATCPKMSTDVKALLENPTPATRPMMGLVLLSNVGNVCKISDNKCVHDQELADTVKNL
jgi:hypothetical protein